jgi:CBS domain-containing protein
MLVEKVMNRHVITVEPEASLLEAMQVMADNHIGCVVVVIGKAKSRKPVGMLTERDVLVAIASEEIRNVKKTKVKAVMTHYLITVGPKRQLQKAIELMDGNKIKKLPVVDNEGKLIGIITASDIISNQPKAVKKIRHLISFRILRRK